MKRQFKNKVENILKGEVMSHTHPVTTTAITNAALNISLVAGDYLEIKSVQPLWATNPATCIYGAYLYFE